MAPTSRNSAVARPKNNDQLKIIKFLPRPLGVQLRPQIMLGDKFLFHLRYAGKNFLRWTCRQRRTTERCPCVLRTTKSMADLRLIYIKNKHTHGDDQEAISRLLCREKHNIIPGRNIRCETNEKSKNGRKSVDGPMETNNTRKRMVEPSGDNYRNKHVLKIIIESSCTKSKFCAKKGNPVSSKTIFKQKVIDKILNSIKSDNMGGLTETNINKKRITKPTDTISSSKNITKPLQTTYIEKRYVEHMDTNNNKKRKAEFPIKNNSKKRIIAPTETNNSEERTSEPTGRNKSQKRIFKSKETRSNKERRKTKPTNTNHGQTHIAKLTEKTNCQERNIGRMVTRSMTKNITKRKNTNHSQTHIAKPSATTYSQKRNVKRMVTRNLKKRTVENTNSNLDQNCNSELTNTKTLIAKLTPTANNQKHASELTDTNVNQHCVVDLSNTNNKEKLTSEPSDVKDRTKSISGTKDDSDLDDIVKTKEYTVFNHGNDGYQLPSEILQFKTGRLDSIIRFSQPSVSNSVRSNRAKTFVKTIIPQLFKKPCPLPLPIADMKNNSFEVDSTEINYSIPIPELAIKLKPPNQKGISCVILSCEFSPTDEIGTITGYEVYKYDLFKKFLDNDDDDEWKFVCKIKGVKTSYVFFEKVNQETKPFFAIRAIDENNQRGPFSTPESLY